MSSNTIDLNGEWQFGYLPELGAGQKPLPTANVDFNSAMPVPGYWDDSPAVFEAPAIAAQVVRNPDYTPIDYKNEVTHEMYTDLTSELPYVLGVGYYRKTFTVPEAWSSGKTVLTLGGVTLQAWVWVNGEEAGHHFGHSTPFDLEVSGLLTPGEENTIVVAVTNLGPERGGFALYGYKGHTAGIYRPMTLRHTGSVRVADCYVFPDKALQQLTWQVEVDGEGDDLTLHWQVAEPVSGAVMGQGVEAVAGPLVSWQTDALGLQHWSDRNPQLYRIELAIRKGDALIETWDQTFGLRRMVRDGVDLFLNGHPIFLRGVTDHCYWVETCNPPLRKEAYRSMLQRHKELGFNWIRFHTWIPSEEYMAAADELGMLLMVEAPRGFERQEWLDIIKTCRRHPSVTIYSGGNEECLDEERIEFLAEMAGILHAQVPDVLFNPQEALRGVEYCWEEEDYGGNTVEEPFKHNPTRMARLKEFSDLFGQYSWTFLSYGLEKAERKHLDSCHAFYGAPLLAHEISIKGTYLDFDLEQRSRQTRAGAGMYESAREVLEDQGLYHNRALYYRNSCAWLRIFRKHVIEMARKCQFNRGYDLLGGHDQHCALQGFHGGLMNDFFELKPGESKQDIIQYNGESVLLLDTSNQRNLNPGDTFKLPLLFSFYGRSTIESGRVTWHMKDDQDAVLVRGEFTTEAVASGTLSEIGEISFIVPDCVKATKLRLAVRLSSDHYEFSNEWDYWCFPKAPSAPVPAGIKVVSEMDLATIDHLEAGGRVVLFGCGGLPRRSVEHSVIMAGRARGNLATVINDHPITRQFPHDGWVNWQFDAMFNQSNAIVFNDLPVAFTPIIEVVSSYKLIRKQSCLFEVRVGKGRLLVCTMNMTQDDAGSRYMKELILSYAGNDALFNPVARLAPEILRHYSRNPSDDIAVIAGQRVNANKEGNLAE